MEWNNNIIPLGCNVCFGKGNLVALQKSLILLLAFQLNLTQEEVEGKMFFFSPNKRCNATHIIYYDSTDSFAAPHKKKKRKT